MTLKSGNAEPYCCTSDKSEGMYRGGEEEHTCDHDLSGRSLTVVPPTC